MVGAAVSGSGILRSVSGSGILRALRNLIYAILQSFIVRLSERVNPEVQMDLDLPLTHRCRSDLQRLRRAGAERVGEVREGELYSFGVQNIQLQILTYHLGVRYKSENKR